MHYCVITAPPLSYNYTLSLHDALPILPVELCEQSAHGAQLQIEGEDGPDRLCLLGHDFELLIDAAIAEGNGSADPEALALGGDRKSTRLNSSHMSISYAVFCLKKKNNH